MQYTIHIRVEVGEETYELATHQEVNTEEWDIEGVTAEALEQLTFKMSAALNPCYWDHNAREHGKIVSCTPVEDSEK